MHAVAEEPHGDAGQLLAQEGGDLPRFYQRVRELAALPKEERTETLDGLLPKTPD